MPNWCANRLYISGAEEQTRQVQKLMEGEIYPRVDVAIGQSVKFFLAGCAGVLKPLTEQEYSPYPALTVRGTGESNRQNRAFSEWLELLKQDAELDEDNCALISRLYTDSGLESVAWRDLTDEARVIIKNISKTKYFDWPGRCVRERLSDESFWEHVSSAAGILTSAPFDMRLILPTRLAVELNGFNGGLLNGVMSAYNYYVWHRYETKWPVGTGLNFASRSATEVTVDFDTPWSPAGEALFAELSRKYQCHIEHFYSEAGSDFCGYRAYSNGQLIEADDGSLEYQEAEEEGWSEICGPDWIIDKVAHYGG